MNPIKNIDQLAHQVRQTLDDIMDLRAALEYDEEYMGDALSFLGPIEEGLQGLADEIATDEFHVRGENLSFIEMLDKVDARLLPFRHMLVWINEIYRDGFAED